MQIRRPPLGVCRVKSALLLALSYCAVVLLHCCTALCCTTVIVNRGQGLRVPTPRPFPPILVYSPQSPSISVYPTQFRSIRRNSKENGHHPGRFRAPEAPEPAFGPRHSSTSEKSSPCLGQGTTLTHMVPDLARWQIRVGGVMLLGASKRPLNHRTTRWPIWTIR